MDIGGRAIPGNRYIKKVGRKAVDTTRAKGLRDRINKENFGRPADGVINNHHITVPASRGIVNTPSHPGSGTPVQTVGDGIVSRRRTTVS